MKKIILDLPISGTRINVPFSAICSLTNKKFGGKVVIEYCPVKKMTLEFVDVEDQINKYCTNKITVEDLTSWFFYEFKKSISLKSLKVTVDVLKSNAHCPVQVWLEK
jgi:NADPH-dependent 7-cyano-7-deazaguanine reductase QueF